MKRTAILLSAAVLLSGCSIWSDASKPGNPGGAPYAGEAGSVFDANAGAPRPVRPDVYERPSSDLLSPAPTMPAAAAPAR
jgi:hypothetical protein